MAFDDDDAAPETLRLDKWLWLARFCKTRAIAQKMATKGRIRINSRPVDKPHALVRVNDIVTLPLPSAVKVLKILALPQRRGPAPEAQATYELLP